MLMLAWALIPVSVLETTWRVEQQQMSAWAGDAPHRWVLSKASASMQQASQDAERMAEGLGDNGFERWLTDRLAASLLWANLLVYRLHILTMWSLLGIPLMLAASMDGFYMRQIRKTAFISQSPIRHKIGVLTFRLVAIALIAWLCLPIPMPTVIAPVLMGLAGFAVWLWVGHLQKRL